MTDAAPLLHPYRTAPTKAARYVCIVCFKTATTDDPGACPCSGAQRLPLDKPEIVEELRAKVQTTRKRRMAWKMGIAGVAAAVLALATCWVFNLQMVPDPGTRHGTGSWLLLLWLAFASVGTGTVSYLGRATLPSDVAGMLRWLRVNISSR